MKAWAAMAALSFWITLTSVVGPVEAVYENGLHELVRLFDNRVIWHNYFVTTFSPIPSLGRTTVLNPHPNELPRFFSVKVFKFGNGHYFSVGNRLSRSDRAQCISCVSIGKRKIFRYTVEAEDFVVAVNDHSLRGRFPTVPERGGHSPTHYVVGIARSVQIVPDYLTREDVRPQFRFGDFLGMSESSFGSAERTIGGPCCGDSRNESGRRCKGLPPEDPSLVFGNRDCLFGKSDEYLASDAASSLRCSSCSASVQRALSLAALALLVIALRRSGAHPSPPAA